MIDSNAADSSKGAVFPRVYYRDQGNEKTLDVSIEFMPIRAQSSGEALNLPLTKIDRSPAVGALIGEQNGRLLGDFSSLGGLLVWESKVDLHTMVPKGVLVSSQQEILKKEFFKSISIHPHRDINANLGGTSYLRPADARELYGIKDGAEVRRFPMDGSKSSPYMEFVLQSGYSREFLSFHQGVMVSVGVYTNVHPHTINSARKVSLDWTEFQKPHASKSLIFDSLHGVKHQVGAAGDRVFLAWDRYMVIGDNGGQNIIGIDFKDRIVRFSVASRNLIAVITDSGERRSLQWINPKREVLKSVGLDGRLMDPVAPPLIGSDGRVVIIGRNAVVGFTKDLRESFQTVSTDRILGGLLDTNDHLLLVTERDVKVLNSDGSLFKTLKRNDSNSIEGFGIGLDGTLYLAGGGWIRAWK